MVKYIFFQSKHQDLIEKKAVAIQAVKAAQYVSGFFRRRFAIDLLSGQHDVEDEEAGRLLDSLERDGIIERDSERPGFYKTTEGA